VERVRAAETNEAKVKTYITKKREGKSWTLLAVSFSNELNLADDRLLPERLEVIWLC
jgi:hypothetical protein